MRNLLVTGGAGFIGSNFIHHMLNLEQDVKIVNLDALTYAGSLENLSDIPTQDNYQFVQGDIVDQALVEALLVEHAIDTIVHFAAESHVDRSIHGPAAFIRTNIQGTFSLLEAARQVWIGSRAAQFADHRFHHISTDEVFGALDPDGDPFSETTPYSPNSPYAASKAASDHLVRAYATTYGLQITISNCSNNYGPYQFPEKLIPLIILNAMSGERLPVYGDGLQIRDWLFVADHCEAIRAILKRGQPGETYNIGGGNQPTNLELIGQLCVILDELLPHSEHVPHSSLIEFVPDRPGHDRRYAMNAEKIRHELGWSPVETLESGLRKTVTWYLENEAWLKKIQERPSLRTWIETNYTHRQADQ